MTLRYLYNRVYYLAVLRDGVDVVGSYRSGRRNHTQEVSGKHGGHVETSNHVHLLTLTFQTRILLFLVGEARLGSDDVVARRVYALLFLHASFQERRTPQHAVSVIKCFQYISYRLVYEL